MKNYKMNEMQLAELQLKKLITRMRRKSPDQVKGFTEAASYLMECYQKRMEQVILDLPITLVGNGPEQKRA